MRQFEIIDQSDDFVVVCKFPGVDFHDCDGTPGLFSLVKAELQLDELYPVHRLDKVTSGLVVLAKSADANRDLCREFAERRVEKYYLAIAKGKPKKKQGAIVGDMAKARRGAWKLLKSNENPALTQFYSYPLESGLRLYLLKPLTGKTHQLRVMMKSIGVPILGDELYAGSVAIPSISGRPEQIADRAYLHAYSLAFSLLGIDYRYRAESSKGCLFGVGSVLQAQLQEIGDPALLSWPKTPGSLG